MELKTTWNPSREMKEETWKNQKTRNSNWTSNLLDFTTH
jgi:hypothetical protein